MLVLEPVVCCVILGAFYCHRLRVTPRKRPSNRGPWFVFGALMPGALADTVFLRRQLHSGSMPGSFWLEAPGSVRQGPQPRAGPLLLPPAAHSSPLALVCSMRIAHIVIDALILITNQGKAQLLGKSIPKARRCRKCTSNSCSRD